MLSRGSNRAARGSWAIGPLLAILLASVAPGLAADAPDSIEEWHEGPVRYLMSRKEVRLFERTADDQERLEFIQRFWDRRDPDPRTPENELRVVFWSRVQEANRRFSDSVHPGWKTDRGKIFILLGPPDDTERDLYYDTGNDVGSRGLLRWHYEGRRSRTPHALTVIAFVREISGDWRITDDPRLSSMYFDINAISWGDRYQDLSGLTGTMERLINGVPWQGSTLDVAMDLARLQEVPTERELLRTVVEAEDFVGTLPGAARIAPIVSRRGERLTAITLAVRRDRLKPAWDGTAGSLGTRFVASAQLIPAGEDASREVVDIPEEAFVAEPAPAKGDPWLRFQAIRPVPAGSWNLSGAILDRRGGGSAVIRRDLEIAPSPEEGPRLTGPILARAIHQSQGPARSASATEPFRLWDQLVIPRMSDELSTEEPFALYVEAHPPADLEDTPVELQWGIEHAEPGSETFQPLADPGTVEDGRGPRAWSYEPGRLPPGRFLLTFTATDAEGRSTSRTLTFEVFSPGAVGREADPGS